MQAALTPSVCLELYPKSSFQICAFVVEDDGGVLPALITCGALALADARVNTSDVTVACSVVATTDSSFIPTPDAAEEHRALGSMCVAKMATLGKVTYLASRGTLSSAGFDDAFAVADAGCAEIARVAREELCLGQSGQ
mmetsp:Transcript_16920/g.49007  ORF Transcript_16920/g.49007 Transcript_16920/m.49007 type:complete len:139 (+) Transcript_16920:102-518(+)